MKSNSSKLKPSAKDILSNKKEVLQKTGRCVICDRIIPRLRVEALEMLGTDLDRWTHVECSTEQRRKGEYLGLPGASELKIVDKLYNDSVRDHLGHTDKEEMNHEEEEDENKI